jgi:hypothetical protein
VLPGSGLGSLFKGLSWLSLPSMNDYCTRSVPFWEPLFEDRLPVRRLDYLRDNAAKWLPLLRFSRYRGSGCAIC